MNNGRLTIKISGREALPVRAIPYVASLRFPPDVLVNCLARGEEGSFSRHSTLTAYRIPSNAPVPVKPREWLITAVKLKGFKARLNQRNTNYDIGNEEWRDGATAKLPAGVFVWLDELGKEYQADRERVTLSSPHPGDDKLILAPMVDSDTRAMVMMGFEPYNEAINQATEATVATVNEVAKSPSTEKPWLIADPKDPEAAQNWYIPARYFARQLVKDDTSLLTKRSLLADKIVQSLTNAGIKKRGGKKPFNSGTILKSLSNVSLG